MRVSVSHHKTRKGSLTLSTPRRGTEWGWAYPSVVPLLRVIMAGYGPFPMMVREPTSRFPYLAYLRAFRIARTSTQLKSPPRRTQWNAVRINGPAVPVVDDEEPVRKS